VSDTAVVWWIIYTIMQLHSDIGMCQMDAWSQRTMDGKSTSGSQMVTRPLTSRDPKGSKS